MLRSMNEEAPLSQFLRDLPQALRFPISGRGLPTLVASGVAFAIFDFFASYAMFFGGLIALSLTGYIFLYLQAIISAAAEGEDEMPFWPDMLNPIDMLSPLLRYVVLVLLCFGPALAWTIYALNAQSHPHEIPVGALVLFVIGALYFPMALLALTISNNWEGVLPHIVLPSIAKSLPAYGALCLTLAMFAALAGVARHVLNEIPLLGALVAGVFSFYQLGFLGFALGRFYRAYEGTLRF